MPLGEDDLRRQVLGRAAQCPGAVLDALGEAKVGHFAVAVPVEQQVLRLQVAVKDRERVQMFEHQSDLGGVEARRVVWEAPRLAQVREELAADDVLHHQVEVEVVLEGPHQVNDERVRDLLQNELLRLDMLNLLEVDDLGLFQNFQCIKVAICPIFHQPDTPKGASAKRLAKLKASEAQAVELTWHGWSTPIYSAGKISASLKASN
mmetsp:Transcript_20766/g.43839  ORF Transcript_20766/g.43839 Transcript_20766/m.43839 type:complete len:206 (+) Transcript_20766:989-1606(+)